MIKSTRTRGGGKEEEEEEGDEVGWLRQPPLCLLHTHTYTCLRTLYIYKRRSTYIHITRQARGGLFQSIQDTLTNRYSVGTRKIVCQFVAATFPHGRQNFLFNDAGTLWRRSYKI